MERLFKQTFLFVGIMLLAVVGCGRRPSARVNELAEKLLLQGQALQERNEDDSALVCYDKALEHEDELPDSTRAYLYGQISALWQQRGDMPKSIYWGKRSFELGETAFAPENLAIVAGNLGMSYRRCGSNDSALLFYEKGVEIMKDVKGNEDVTAFLCNNMSVLYCEMERYDEALDFARRAAALSKEYGDDTEYYSARANEGIVLAKNGRGSEAKVILEDVYSRSGDVVGKNLALKALSYLIFVARMEGDDEAARRWFGKAAPLLEGMPQENVQAQGIADARMNYDYENGRYAEALKQAAALDSLKERIQVIPLCKLRQFQGRCLERLGRLKEALEYERMAAVEKDSASSVDLKRQLSEYSVKFKTQETQMALLRAESDARKKTMTIWILAGAFLILALLLLWLVYVYRTRRRRLEERHRLERTQRYLEGLEEERARVAAEIHDGACNDLLGIALMLRTQDADRDDLCRRISELRDGLRRMSHEQMPPEFRYADLREILQDYVKNIPHPASVSLRFSSEGEGWGDLPHGVAYQYYRMAQEALSNALRHSSASAISLHLAFDGHTLRMEVADNGAGASESDIERGLKSIRERTAGIGALLDVKKAESGFSLSISYGKP